GSDPLFPRASRERTAEFADELSLLWGDTHRVKVGVLAQGFAFRQETAANRHGSFGFASLADFEAGRPSSFSRSLAPRPVRGTGWNGAAYLGDAWRPAPRLQLTYGVRLEASGYGERPASNAAADSAWGLRTDHAPAEVHVSPRAGFSLRLNPRGQPLRQLHGGIGEFRGRVPAALYADALASAAGAGGLVCVGEGRVPAPDFHVFAADPASIPTACAGGGPGAEGARPDLVGFGRGFQAPRAWRGSLGYRAQFRRLLGGSVEAAWARGVSQYRVQDLNLRAAPTLLLAQEGGRPLFGDPAAVNAGTGDVGLFSSRADPRFAHVYRLLSDAASETRQLSLGLNGVMPGIPLSFQLSYTLTHARDQASFSFGGAGQGFASTPTRGDPNRLEWAPSDVDRRHSFVAVAGLPLGRAVEVSLIGRGGSGMPFTPRVGGDVNGDGARNDAAFIVDPAHTTDPALAAGMERLLAQAPRGLRRCLEGQLGQVARRNSCRTGWSAAFDLHAAIRPQVNGGRMSIGVEAYNLGSGLDLLLHGRAGVRGWGQDARAIDPVLLYPRGFDPVAGAFRYQANEAFGRSAVHRATEGAPFLVSLSARMVLGPRPRREPLGGFADVGTPGLAAGALARLGMSASAGGAGPEALSGSALDDADEPGHGPGPARLIAKLLPDPVSAILSLADSLGLTPEMVGRLAQIRDTLQARNGPLVTEVTRIFNAAFSGEGSTDPDQLFSAIGPQVNEGRRNVQTALAQVEASLGPELWARVPESIRNAVSTNGLELRRGPP
ncbi:MAG TPA: hypothetical protein VM890_11735, partial [Longimicrobium sp.]|nr:hypothetical protein [Longimicrobium sp.]